MFVVFVGYEDGFVRLDEATEGSEELVACFSCLGSESREGEIGEFSWSPF